MVKAMYQNPKTGRVVYVSRGVSWISLFFPIIMLLVFRLYGQFILAFIGMFLASMVQRSLDPLASLIGTFGIAAIVVYVAIEINSWREADLQRKGYQFLGFADTVNFISIK